MIEGDVTLAGPGWRGSGALAVRGRAFDPAGEPVDLLEAFRPAKTGASIAETAGELRGHFGLIRRTPEAVYLACDLARSIPLYFSVDPPVWVGDSVDPARIDSEPVDPIAESEFALTRYVTRGETLLPTVRSVRAGEVVRVPRGEPGAYDRHRYAAYRPTARIEGDRSALLETMRAVLESVFDRAAAVIGDRTAVVPLSGGIDSRLVATMLVDRGCEVLAVTFGRRGHADVEVSRDVAAALGIDWEWVEYATDRWSAWYHSADRRAYHDDAFNLDALPFLAEWPAVRELRARDRLPADAVVCPGHTVATPSERVPAGWIDGDPSAGAVIAHILEHHYDLWDWTDPDVRAAFEDRIAADAGLDAGLAGAAAYEHWEWTTRMTTFTTGDMRCYDWFDLEWWLPLWDPEFVRFWATVPLRHRQGKALKRAFTQRAYARVAGVDRSAAARTDRDWGPVDQIRRTFRTSPLEALDAGFESWLGAQATPRDRWERWGNYPLGWYGVIPERDADRFAAATNLYALRTLEALGRVSFDPPWIADPPLERHLALPPSGTPDGSPNV